MTLAPYQQGQLDNLCGLYGVINATRLAILPRRMKSADARHFFDFLVSGLHDDGMVFDAITNGLNVAAIRRLVTRADHWLQRNYGVALRTTPAALTDEVARIRVVQTISRHLAQPHASVLAALDRGPLGLHWTVVKKVADGSLTLFDSSGARRVSLAHRTQETVRLPPKQTLLLKAEPY